MSSAVNKSQKRFMPSMASRGPGARGPPRRVSTLRTSFSVPNSQKSSSSQSQSTPDKPEGTEGIANVSGADAVALIRSQLLKGTTKGMEGIPESAVEDTIAPPTKRVRISDTIEIGGSDTSHTIGSDLSPETETDASGNSSRPSSNELGSHVSTNAGSMNTTRVVNSSSSLRPSVSTARPRSAGNTSTVWPSLGSPQPIETQSSARPSSDPTGAIASKRSMQKPEAPEGFVYIWPEDLPGRKKEERRRKQTVEKELLAIMKELYAEKETKQLLEDHVGMNEEVAKAMGEEAASTATYHQLKQKVGLQAREKRDKKLQEELDSENRKEEERASKTLLDVNKFTMASLCRDIPVGDMNPTYDDYELARVNRRRDTLRVFRAKMWSRRMYEPKDSEKAELKEAYQKYQRDRVDRMGKIKSEQEQKFTEIDDESQTVDGSGSHPQASIEIQADGSISLVGTQFDRHKNNRTQREGGTSGPKTEVDPTEQRINSSSFSTRERPDRWTAEETEKFYSAVSALGTDFNLIAHLFPLRSRNQIKTKYKYEEKRNPAKLQIHLVSRRKFNLDSYSKVSNIAIQDVNSIENELEKVREEHEKQMEIEAESRLVAKAEDQKNKNQSKPSSRPKRERKD